MTDVAVIIPTYNSAKYLPEAVESVLMQTHKRFELIIVDDGSTDDTIKVLERYRDRIRYIHQRNEGSYKARNRGIQATRSRYVAFLDADDMWMPNKLEAQLDFLRANPNLGLVFSDAVFFRENGDNISVVKTFWDDTGWSDVMKREYKTINHAFARLMEKNFILPSTALVKRECFDKVGLFDERYRNVGDKDMWLRMCVHFSMGCVPRPLVRRRIHSYSARTMESIHASVISVINKIEEMYPDLIERERVKTKKIKGQRYYFLGRFYLDQDELARAKRAFISSIYNSISVKSLVFLTVCLFGLRAIRSLRRVKNMCMRIGGRK